MQMLRRATAKGTRRNSRPGRGTRPRHRSRRTSTATPGKLVRTLLRPAQVAFPNGVRPAADAIDQLGGLPAPTRYVPGSWPRSVAAAPARLRELIEAMVAELQPTSSFLRTSSVRRATG